MSLILVALVSSLVINAFFFILAVLNQSDRVTDLSYSLSFVLIALQYTLTQTNPTFFQTLLACMIIIWGLRLGTYLFFRNLKLKKDSQKSARFWLLQAISVAIIILPALIVLLARHIPRFWQVSFIGFVIWSVGLVLETVADYQKSQYKSLKDPPTPWVSTGLYKFARHPNYFGEMLCWWGIFIYALPYLSGWAWLTVVSPVYITSLLLSKCSSQKYTGDPGYAAYKSSTHLLIPIPKK